MTCQIREVAFLCFLV